MDHPKTIEETEVETTRPRRSGISWGAVLGGTVVTLAVLWFLQLLGATIGFGVIDLTDPGAGLAWIAVAWLVLMSIAAFVVGGMFAGRLSGETDETNGLLHGVGTWATTTLVLLLLGAMGMSTIVRGTAAAAETTATAVTSGASAATTTAAQGAAAVGERLWDARDAAIVDEARARLKSRASEMVAEAAAEDRADVEAGEVERAIEAMDAETAVALADALATGETEDATRILADAVSGLSEDEIDAVVAGVSRELRAATGLAEGDRPVGEQLAAEARRMLAAQVARLDAEGPPEVDRADVRSALDDLEPATLQTIAWRLLQDDPDGAQAALVAETSLTDDEAEELVAGARADLEGTIEEYREMIAARVDAAGDYAQGVLWISLCLSALCLGGAALGGWYGTLASRVVTSEVRSTTPAARREARGAEEHRGAVPAAGPRR